MQCTYYIYSPTYTMVTRFKIVLFKLFSKPDKIIYKILYQTCLGKYQRELSQLYHGHILATA